MNFSPVYSSFPCFTVSFNKADSSSFFFKVRVFCPKKIYLPQTHEDASLYFLRSSGFLVWCLSLSWFLMFMCGTSRDGLTSYLDWSSVFYSTPRLKCPETGGSWGQMAQIPPLCSLTWVLQQSHSALPRKFYNQLVSFYTRENPPWLYLGLWCFYRLFRGMAEFYWVSWPRSMAAVDWRPLVMFHSLPHTGLADLRETYS
jgi:hypothetical protein